jgi:uncharacterized protein (TIGR02246 family)
MLGKPADAATAFAEAWNRHDAQGLAALFSPNANFVNVVGLWWKNRDGLAHQGRPETRTSSRG